MATIEIASHEVHLWETSLSIGEDELRHDETLLSPGERRYVARFTNDRARDQFIISRAKLRELLGAYAGEEPHHLRFGMTREGKPFLSSAGEFEFNLTHSGDLTLFGVARSRPVGVDMERIREMPRAIALAKRFMSPEEFQRVATASPETRDHEFLSCFVRREGSGKAYGVGVWRVLENGSRSVAPNPLFAEITRDYACKVINYNKEYVAAVAALGDDWTLIRRGAVSQLR